MRVLYIAPGEPITPDYSGASSRYYQNFAALTRLYGALDVIRLCDPRKSARTSEFEQQSSVAQQVHHQANSWRDVALPPERKESRLARMWQSTVDPVGYEFKFTPQICSALAAQIKQHDPTLIWVERTELAAALINLDLSIPWILSQHDIRSYIQRIRSGSDTLLKRWNQFACQRAETLIFRAAPLIITGASGDAKRSDALGAKRVEVIPMAYDSTLPAPAPQTAADTPVTISHLGSLETTANRVGLEAYLRVVQPQIRSADAVLQIIGDDSRLREPIQSLLSAAKADLKGFVPDLSDVLHPFNIAILPYEIDSGYRTKLPVLFNHAQAVVTTRAAVSGMWLDGLDQVCVVVERLEDFPQVLTRLMANPAERERLGRAAHAFCEQHFTLDAVIEQYRSVIDSLTA